MDTKCSEPGCEQEGIPCREPSGWGRREALRDLKLLFRRRDWRALVRETWHWLRWGDVTVITYYCPSHCEQNGFCYLCGQFWSGGDEYFDFGGYGVCSNCQHEFVEYDPDDFDDGGYWRDPYEEDVDEDRTEWDDVIVYGPDAA